MDGAQIRRVYGERRPLGRDFRREERGGSREARNSGCNLRLEASLTPARFICNCPFRRREVGRARPLSMPFRGELGPGGVVL